jgi:hypothetical protein
MEVALRRSVPPTNFCTREQILIAQLDQNSSKQRSKRKQKPKRGQRDNAGEKATQNGGGFHWMGHCSVADGFDSNRKAMIEEVSYWSKAEQQICVENDATKAETLSGEKRSRGLDRTDRKSRERERTLTGANPAREGKMSRKPRPRVRSGARTENQSGRLQNWRQGRMDQRWQLTRPW